MATVTQAEFSTFQLEIAAQLDAKTSEIKNELALLRTEAEQKIQVLQPLTAQNEQWKRECEEEVRKHREGQGSLIEKLEALYQVRDNCVYSPC